MNKTTLIYPLISAFIGLTACSAPEIESGPPLLTSTADTLRPDGEKPVQIAEDVDAEKFKSLIDAGAGNLLDVRTPEEYAMGHIAGSINLDFKGPDFSTSLDTLDKSVPVYVYCQGGGRSGQAMEIMREKGFSAVYNLLGGYGSWPYK